MKNETIEYKAMTYVYDLNNCAIEYGFKGDEGWELSLVTALEKTALEKKYYPTVTVKALPETLLKLVRLVKNKLIDAKYDIERKFDTADNVSMQYLVAFNPKRAR
ncbi:hypothetical protein GCM10027049_14010 [Mucilaginibacter puniceus]